MSAADWYTDPSGTHEHRYWDGTSWTEHVADAGVRRTHAPPSDLAPPLTLGDAPGAPTGPAVVASTGRAPTARPQAVEYKVLTQKDRALSRKFDPYVLEEALNAYAREGWRVVSSATAEFPGFLSGQREELIVVLERPL